MKICDECGKEVKNLRRGCCLNCYRRIFHLSISGRYSKKGIKQRIQAYLYFFRMRHEGVSSALMIYDKVNLTDGFTFKRWIAYKPKTISQMIIKEEDIRNKFRKIVRSIRLREEDRECLTREAVLHQQDELYFSNEQTAMNVLKGGLK